MFWLLFQDRFVAHLPSMEATQDDREHGGEETVREMGPSFPMGRVKKIVKLDGEINKVNSEALFLISLAADHFLGSLAAGARASALQKKRRIIKLDHIRAAARAHRPTSDFLLDCLPKPIPPPPKAAAAAYKTTSADEASRPPGARRIDDFFRKPSAV